MIAMIAMTAMTESEFYLYDDWYPRTCHKGFLQKTTS
jgi:hypothetical protein